LWSCYRHNTKEEREEGGGGRQLSTLALGFSSFLWGYMG
jgi:hypothetical protein